MRKVFIFFLSVQFRYFIRRTYRSVGVVELVPYDDADPLEGLLCAEPGRHARVDDDGDAPLLPLIQSQTFLLKNIYENPLIEPTVFHIISFMLGPKHGL
jgi:hypothetical protein